MDYIMNIFTDYFVVIVVLACLCVGFILKHLVPGEKINRFIPLIMALLGVLFNVWINGWVLTPEILIAGLLSGLASTGLHQLFKQFIETGIGEIFKKMLGSDSTDKEV